MFSGDLLRISAAPRCLIWTRTKLFLVAVYQRRFSDDGSLAVLFLFAGGRSAFLCFAGLVLSSICDDVSMYGLVGYCCLVKLSLIGGIFHRLPEFCVRFLGVGWCGIFCRRWRKWGIASDGLGGDASDYLGVLAVYLFSISCFRFICMINYSSISAGESVAYLGVSAVDIVVRLALLRVPDASSHYFILTSQRSAALRGAWFVSRRWSEVLILSTFMVGLASQAFTVVSSLSTIALFLLIFFVDDRFILADLTESTDTTESEISEGGGDRDREREGVILINPFNQTIIVQGSFNPNQSQTQNQSENHTPIGSLGDYFIGPGLELLLQHLADTDPNRYGTPPAKKEAMEAMATVKIDQVVQCSVCLDDFELESEATEMPCKHKFHKGCITPWLELHSSCPVCRYQLPSDESKPDTNEPNSSTDTNNSNVENENGNETLLELLSDISSS